ncbi:hypothetical protein QAD02_018576 [Eretmocerus hayati]|uniref:Uncharacterized protein n=1 Tax=Eretmocerus hayati TaxID=131215 RepID=A0ACC2PHK7_9HYME|nr:hypothetical protein QAD02_018576 [Eretmocerus hayati]
MGDEKMVIELDNISEEGELKKSPASAYYSEEDGADTADSLEIKPPQAVVRHRKTTSHRRDKHPDRSSGGERRDDKERKLRHHETRLDDGRHRDKHSRHRRHEVESAEKARRSDPSVKREREPSRHERKERSTGDRVLEDLRESSNQSRSTNRLLDKRRERREDRPEYKLEASSSSSSSRNRAVEESSGRREMRAEELRREMRLISGEEVSSSSSSRRDMRMDEHRSSGGGGSRHVREAEMTHRERNRVEQMDVSAYEEYDRVEPMEHQHHHHTLVSSKDPKEMTEQELRRQKLIDAEREMARRKESSRIELEARRLRRGEKRQHSPEFDPRHDPSVVELMSDESEHPPQSDEVSTPKSNRSRVSDEEMRDVGRTDRSDDGSSDSSDSSSDDDDDDDSNDSNDSDSNKDSESNSDYNNSSPLSVDQLAKSDRSNGESPGHIDANGSSAKTAEIIDMKTELELQMELPPYYPALQGCRSVEEYKCLNRIAEGTYGVVYRAEDRRTKEIVALKRLKMEKEKDGFPITSLREINTLLKAQHPNIVTVREIVVGSNMDKIFIVMDYVEHDLKSLMETMKSKDQRFIPGEIKCIMQQLLRAVAHLHDNWILHRDLKTSNLLLSHRGILKVGDFGLAREYGSPLKQYTSIVVTLWYRAPELLLGSKEYSTPIDIWSVGCIFAELLRMEALFPGKSEMDLLNRVFKELGSPNDKIWPGYSKLPMVKKIPFAHFPVNNLRQRFTLSLSDAGIELLTKFLTYDPAQRITADEALKHTYFTESPLPIDPSMFPTWPAKSEFGVKVNASPKPPSGGKEFKQLGEKEDEDDDSASGFHMGTREVSRQLTIGGGFSLKF